MYEYLLNYEVNKTKLLGLWNNFCIFIIFSKTKNFSLKLVINNLNRLYSKKSKKFFDLWKKSLLKIHANKRDKLAS